MRKTTARVTSKGQLTVPKAIRERLGIREGDELEFVEDKGRVVLRKRLAESPFDRYVGHLKHLRGRDPDDLVREMRGQD